MNKLKKIGIGFLIAGMICFLLATVFFVEYQIWLEYKQAQMKAPCNAPKNAGCGVTMEGNSGMEIAKFYATIGIILSVIGVTLLVVDRISQS